MAGAPQAGPLLNEAGDGELILPLVSGRRGPAPCRSGASAARLGGRFRVGGGEGVGMGGMKDVGLRMVYGGCRGCFFGLLVGVVIFKTFGLALSC